MARGTAIHLPLMCAESAIATVALNPPFGNGDQLGAGDATSACRQRHFPSHPLEATPGFHPARLIVLCLWNKHDSGACRRDAANAILVQGVC
jgi:hypothetical protein